MSPYSSDSLVGPARNEDVEEDIADWVVERRSVRRKESVSFEICSVDEDEARRVKLDGEKEVDGDGDRDERTPRVFWIASNDSLSSTSLSLLNED